MGIKGREHTAVGTGEKHLLNVGLGAGHGIDMSLVFVRGSRLLSPVDLIMTVHTGDIGVVGVHFLGLGFPAGAEGREEFDATLIESQGMTEDQDGIVRTRKRQVFRDQADGLDSVPRREVRGVCD